MEYKRVYIEYFIDTPEGEGAFPIDGDETNKADLEIALLIKNGWRIVSAVPITASIVSYQDLKRDFSKYSLSYTCGIEVFMVK